MAGGSNNIAHMSPRQRMINLMYIVLTAMLALNVSSDVLNGFSQVHEGLRRTNNNLRVKNQVQFQYLADIYASYPQKAAKAYNEGLKIHNMTDSLYNVMERLKEMIAEQADGKGAKYSELVNLDDLEASSAVMLNPMTKRGEHLKQGIDRYRKFILSFITDSVKRAAVAEVLSTAIQKQPGIETAPTWQQQMFESKPAIAAVTMLTKLQGDLLQAENEAMSNIITNISQGPTSHYEALVIPNSTVLQVGEKYTARILLASVDTVHRPAVYVGGKRLPPNGIFSFAATGVGEHTYTGYVEMPFPDGSVARYDFRSSYTVTPQMTPQIPTSSFTIAPTMMNVLYAGIDNPISITVGGTAANVSASMTNGTLSKSGDHWVARVSAIGQEATINVSAGGRQVGSMKFRIRKLPDPTAYMLVGNNQYKGTPRRISKAALMGCSGVKAALDDGILDIQYTVVTFKTIFFDSMGNAIPETSAGASFSERQRQQFTRLKPGARFFISEIKAKGPDGVTRDISPMEVALN